ncbi:MAG TPA: M23 family metallopeptidase [Anaerolineae bacterium]|nr:M23 family metallopeptidase [Anaerolineae bacterium]
MKKFFLLLFLTTIISGCSNFIGTEKNDSLNSTDITISTEEPTLTYTPTAIASTNTPLPPTPTPIPFTHLCSPLENISLEELPNIITGPFDRPPLGFDNRHQGVDFSYYRYKDDQDGISGLPVQSVLDGRVIAIIIDRNPYGNAVIIETPLDIIKTGWLPHLQLPQIEPTIIIDPRNMCPEEGQALDFDYNYRSLYLIYAHLQEPSTFHVGEKINCGQVIGAVGNTGKSTNPHLHFEIRIGPSNATFDSMAKYDTRASELEMYNYCVWRLSNLFQLLDPMILLSYKESIIQ